MSEIEKNISSRSPIISVIVPVYNASRWLHDALDSLSKQTYVDFEAILVNDGSTDDSEEICRGFVEGDKRFRLINQSNQGVSAARNHGLDLASGSEIAFLDADDVMPVDSLETLYRLRKETGAEIVAGQFVRRVPTEPVEGVDNYVVLSSDEAIMVGLYQEHILNNPWGVMFDRQIFERTPKLRFRKCRYEDLDLFYQAFERAVRVCVTDKVVYFYRDNPGSFINTWSQSRLDVLDVTERMVEHFRSGDPRLFRAACDRRFSAACNMLVEMVRHGIDDPIQRERCIDIIRLYRKDELSDSRVRLKNKIGALISYPLLPVLFGKFKKKH